MKYTREQIKESVVRKGYKYFENGDYNPDDDKIWY